MSLGADLRDGVVGIKADWAFVVACFDPGISDIPLDDPYVVVMCECRMCGNRDLVAYPLDIYDETCQQCSNCKHKTSEPVTDDRVVVTDE